MNHPLFGDNLKRLCFLHRARMKADLILERFIPSTGFILLLAISSLAAESPVPVSSSSNQSGHTQPFILGADLTL